jgi:leukotriene-A4 hydrolase
VTEHRFGAIDSDDFVALCERVLPGALATVDGRAWLDGAGVPDGAPAPRAAKLEAVERAAAASAGTGALPSLDETAAWSPTEWELYLEALPRPFARCAELDERFALTNRGNYEVLVAWLVLALASHFDAVLPRVDEVLGKVGRMKYLRPLYGAMIRRGGALRERAARLFATTRDGYHPIARQVVEGLVAG